MTTNYKTKMTRMIKVFLFGLLFSLSVLMAGAVSTTQAVTPPASTVGCDDPRNPNYASEACVRQQLGLDQIKSPTFLNPADPRSIVTVLFQLILGIVVILVVYRIVVSGMMIANAKEDADKRKDGLKSVMNAVIGLVIAFSAYGITLLVLQAFGVKPDELSFLDCQQLIDQGAAPEVITRCQEIQNGNP